MEQPVQQPQQIQSVRIVIEWDARGTFRIAWPQVDDVIKLGLLEMAKSVLIEARAKAGTTNNAGLIVPGRIAN